MSAGTVRSTYYRKVQDLLAAHPNGAWTADEIVRDLMVRNVAALHRSTVCLALGQLLDDGAVHRFMYHGDDVWQIR